MSSKGGKKKEAKQGEDCAIFFSSLLTQVPLRKGRQHDSELCGSRIIVRMIQGGVVERDGHSISR